ncbi:MAG: Re/Si-specific NAD(P)(+) transhydrogenase subunit alpha [Solirubrobacterales bacterium]|nr:Re/Si-specific NAD(P)(+) transhydrogenase subunit alpha [Solirubrobacterales bacterium]
MGSGRLPERSHNLPRRVKIGVPEETANGERRVALVPDVVKSLKKNEHVEVLVESGSGEAAGHTDAAYTDAGAEIVAADAAWGADVVLRVAVPSTADIGRLKSSQLLISHLAPWTSAETNQALAAAGVTSFAMEAIPRTTRAQAMDALSSQAAAAGYAAMLMAARESGRFFGMMTTAAGTVPPAKVLVLGAGVAGLQAVATGKRLGAIVTGFDIRRAAWEQIASLGGRPLELDFIPDAEGEGGYARPLTDEENAQVRDALAANAAKQDIVVTTAAIPGRPAPLLITADAVRGMAPGSVIVDLAAETGGNCELTKAGETVVENGVKVLGPRNLASEMPVPASQLYSKNLENLLKLLITEEGEVKVDFEDDILAAACITEGGQIKNERAAGRKSA